ncbi:hypothetical protein [Staphylococcus caeli]|uniref:hypothetical protein n=1 Tax=Staphylococcus caeli TaxID=2201815 RepID=UPI003F57F7B9
MRVNHASTLSVNYFVSYLNLIMISRRNYVKRSHIMYEERFFKDETDRYGKMTETHFNLAIQKLKQK